MNKPIDKIQAAIAAQAALCAANNYPHFAPGNGVCWSCHSQIYEELDGKTFVTGCPFCHKSYCD